MNAPPEGEAIVRDSAASEVCQGERGFIALTITFANRQETIITLYGEPRVHGDL